MDFQNILNLGVGAAIAVFGWFARELWVAVKDLKEDIHKIEVELPSHYLRKDEFAEGMKEIKDMLRQIFDKLDGKVDKHWGDK
jgi:cell fate (sporulation/competence/biofilm development) regulator YmcA (YheA/YmcA/DUF963 family)